ncbi:hypothetical protein [Cryobacterium gelidum]|uniref:DUF1508 domain-containing protein n=1 Tax=Cryobacterium gelidum TaxID=1259164 RepID=A0A4R9AYE5_9MICO|nr:hypothetical protein [Cryobacterium gelidum]TFD72652.1 hypothetical protein E3T50_04815 [Cryobacterium gelidum]
MSTSASVVFSAFISATDPRLQGWLSHRGNLQANEYASDRVVRSPSSRDSRGETANDRGHAPQAGIWRLLAPNGREIGRSSSVYGAFTVAQTHVLDLQTRVDRMVATTVTGPSAGTHGWVMSVDDISVMTSGRWYGTTSTTKDACAGAREAFRNALVMADARRLMPSGARRPRLPSSTPHLAGSW